MNITVGNGKTRVCVGELNRTNVLLFSDSKDDAVLGTVKIISRAGGYALIEQICEVMIQNGQETPFIRETMESIAQILDAAQNSAKA